MEVFEGQRATGNEEKLVSQYNQRWNTDKISFIQKSPSNQRYCGRTRIEGNL
jgi:hypothetical protein